MDTTRTTLPGVVGTSVRVSIVVILSDLSFPDVGRDSGPDDDDDEGDDPVPPFPPSGP